jgi:hypothetical protein
VRWRVCVRVRTQHLAPPYVGMFITMRLLIFLSLIRSVSSCSPCHTLTWIKSLKFLKCFRSFLAVRADIP